VVTSDSSREVKSPVETGAEVYAIDRLGVSPLHDAADACKPEVVSLLLGSGADLEACDIETGIRPLHVAAKKGCLQACELLVRHGAEINAQTREGTTALHLAARAGHAEVVLLLLKYLANHTLQDAQGHTATHYAQQAGHLDIVKHIEQHRQTEWPYLHMSNR
jgi:ankyrin repeat protein